MPIFRTGKTVLHQGNENTVSRWKYLCTENIGEEHRTMQMNPSQSILPSHYKEDLCTPLQHVSTARPRSSVYIIKKLCARRFHMHQQRDCDFRLYYKKNFVLAGATCINGETAIFGIYYKEALCSPLKHISTARPRFSVYIIKKLSARRCNMYQRETAIFGIL